MIPRETILLDACQNVGVCGSWSNLEFWPRCETSRIDELLESLVYLDSQRLLCGRRKGFRIDNGVVGWIGRPEANRSFGDDCEDRRCERDIAFGGCLRSM